MEIEGSLHVLNVIKHNRAEKYMYEEKNWYTKSNNIQYYSTVSYMSVVWRPYNAQWCNNALLFTAMNMCIAYRLLFFGHWYRTISCAIHNMNLFDELAKKFHTVSSGWYFTIASRRNPQYLYYYWSLFML